MFKPEIVQQPVLDREQVRARGGNAVKPGRARGIVVEMNGQRIPCRGKGDDRLALDHDFVRNNFGTRFDVVKIDRLDLMGLLRQQSASPSLVAAILTRTLRSGNCTIRFVQQVNTMTDTDRTYPSVRALERGLALLAALNQAGRSDPASLARLAGVDRTTAYRMLHTLAELGYVARSESDGQFVLTPAVRALSEGLTETDLTARIVCAVG